MRFSIFSVFALAAGLAGCGEEPKPYHQQAYVFGTLVEISIDGEEEARARQAAGEVSAEFDRLHKKLHAWKPGPMKDLNDAFAQPGRRAPLDQEMSAILQDATRLSELSGGLFNPAIGRLIALWGFHSDEIRAALPDAAQVKALAAARPRMTDIALSGGQAESRNGAVHVDLGGYAKGYALDRAAALLKARGVRNALVNVGGNVLALGSHGKRPWRIGIQHPRKPGPLAVLDLRDGEAIGTSGDYQRYYEVGGQRYSHLIDPRSGYPAQGVQAATVLIAPGPGAGTLSDVASKPLFIAGPAGWRQAAESMGVTRALLIDAKGEIHVTPALRQRLEFLEPGLALHEIH
ncbi:MAG: FAD:protein FMN transferase [Betaproteobacteria bacterium]|nr:FAD:protein FMN transferase [Betaproteobacteria bacterium]